MSRIEIELPNSMQEKFEELAQRQGMPLERILFKIISNQFATIKVRELLRKKDSEISWDEYHAILRKAPDVPPLPGDELPDDLRDALNKKFGR